MGSRSCFFLPFLLLLMKAIFFSLSWLFFSFVFLLSNLRLPSWIQSFLTSIISYTPKRVYHSCIYTLGYIIRSINQYINNTYTKCLALQSFASSLHLHSQMLSQMPSSDNQDACHTTAISRHFFLLLPEDQRLT